MKPYLNYIYCCLCLMLLQQITAQNSQLRAYTIEDGLPQSQVYDILQDDMGYLWLGTQGGGLANFDGDKFKVWNEKGGLLSNYIHALYFQNDSLFIGSKKGLSIKVKNNFLNFECPQIRQFHPAENNMYLATDKGVYSFSKDGRPRKLSLHPDIDASSINAINFDGKHYFLATNKGLWKLSELQDAPSEIIQLEANNFTAVLFHQDKVIAATFDDGVRIMDLKNPDDLFVMPEPTRINAMSIQNKNELWMATENEGIVIVETEKYAEIKRLNTANGLAAPHVRKVFRDNRDNLWIATSGGGFYKYSKNSFIYYDTASGLQGNRVYAVHSAKDGLWVSNSEAGLTKIDAGGVHPISDKSSFFEVKIKTITSDAKGNIWAGSENRGILFRETKMKDSVVYTVSDTFKVTRDTISKRVTENHVIDESKGFPSDWVRKIIVTDDGIWAATYANGIVKFTYDSDKDSLGIHKTFGKKDGISDLLINDFVKDPKGRLWYATQNGQLGYIENDKITTVETPFQQQTPIGTVLFHEDALFLGTSGNGIWYAYMNEPTNFKRLKGAKALFSDNVYQLIFDDQGYLWAGSERGVDKIELNPANEIKDVYHFGKNDGFLGLETCLNAVAKDDTGTLWFGAIYGLTKYMPGENTTTSIKPEVFFTGVEEGYKTIDSLNLKAFTNSGRVLQLTPEQTQLSFSFRTVDLNHPKELQYRSKLDDSDWSPWVSENKQNFVGLAFGAHNFSVQSRNHRWEESSVASFHFFIDTPLHKKGWFQGVILALTVLALIGIALLYIRRLKAKNKAAQERLQTQNYLLTLEQKALRLQMNPHFIFNVLNGIKAMAIGKPEKMNATINSFATLLRETLHNSRKEHIALDQEIKTLRQYIEVEILMAPRPFTYTIDVQTEPSSEEILIPPLLIQPFVENAIRHGILKGDKEGKLQLDFHTSKTHLQCSITDNGRGIFRSQREKTKTDHQSMALEVTKERLESISGPDALQIMEIKDDDGNIAGTKIRFKIPLLTDY